MPDDTFEIPDIPSADEDLLAPTEARFYECGECAIKSGSPTLCADCLERREEFSETGRTRRPLYHTLRNDDERGRYLRYLWRERDNEDESARLITEDDLDREFPDRHEERLAYRWSAHRPRRIPPIPLHANPLILRNSWGMPSIWGPMQVSHLDLASEAEHVQRITEAGMGFRPGQLSVLAGRGSGRTRFAAQMALEAVRRGESVAFVTTEGSVDANATVSRLAENGAPVNAQNLIQEIREAAERLGLGSNPPPPQPLTMGIDFGYDSGDSTVALDDRRYLASANFGLPGLTPDADGLMPEDRYAASESLATVVATLLEEEFLVDVPLLAGDFQEFPVISLRQLLHNVGINPERAGLTPVSLELQQRGERTTAYWWNLARAYAEDLKPQPNRPGPATGPSRFEREFQVPEEAVYQNVEPPPRLAPPVIQASTLTYLNRNSSYSNTRHAYEKLFGDPGEYTLPSRFERINWNDE